MIEFTPVKELFFETRLKYIINRFGVIAGPWQFGKQDQGFVSLWIAKHLFRKKLSYIGFGGYGYQVRDLLHIDDVCEIIYLQIRKLNKVNNETFNIGGGPRNSISLKNLTKRCEVLTNNKIRIKIFKKKIISKNIKSTIKDFDIICDGTDNFETRYLVNDECKKMKKILISAAINRFDGHLYKFNFKKKASCYRCFMPDKPILEKNCETEGIFSPVAGILGSLQANEVLKTIIGLENSLHNQIVIFDSIKINLRKVKLSFNSKCKNKC